jgi:uncharacterized protein YlxW (UPF0749 family)
MGISLTTISASVAIATSIIILVDKTVDLIDKIKRKRREWSKKDEDNEYNKFKKENREKNEKNQKLNSNYRQYNKRPEYRYDYYNDDYDYDLK